MSEGITAQTLSESANSAEPLLYAMWRGENVHQLSYKNTKGYFTPVIVKTVAEAIAQSEKLNVQGFDVYFACAEYLTSDNRKAINSVGTWGYWLDIDCGETKAAKGDGYATKIEAVSALKAFLNDTNISQPSFMVDSGNGLHVYFSSDKFIPKSEWQDGASKLKRLTEKYGLLADPTRTDDIASILRVPNTNNHKDRANLKAVKLKRSKPELKSDILGSIERAYEVVALQSNLRKPKLGNDLGTSKSINIERYTFEENKEDFYNALCAAYPTPSSREEWRIGVCALAYLVAVMEWPENDVIKIRESWENLSIDADKTDNDNQWQDALSRTADKVKSGELITSHLTVLKKARANNWQPKDKTTPDWLEGMNERFFVSPYSTTVAVFRKSEGTYIPLKSDAFKLLHANKLVDVVSNNSSKKISIADIWLKHPSRQEYSGVGFWPSVQAPAGYFNFWQGWPIPPIYGNVSPALEHINKIICNEDETLFKYVMGWLAYCVQHPNEPGYVALVIMGGRGTGKTMFAEWIKLMFGRYAMSIAKGELLTGQFTGHLEKMVILVAEEAFWAGDKAAENALKHVITGTTLSIHPKGFAPYDAPNYLHVIMTSNEDWVVPAGVDERRFAVCTVSDSKKGNTEYFKNLAQWADNGGIAAFLDYLLNYDLRGFNVRTPPDTMGLRNQKLMSLEPASRWILNRLEIGAFAGSEWKQEVLASVMVNDFCEQQHLNQYERRRAETQLGNTIRKIFPSVKKSRHKKDGVRGTIYVIPAISLHAARAAFEKYTGMNGFDWGSDE